MPITLDDLTVNFSHLDRDTLLSDWIWLIGPTRLPILISAIGNAFLQDTEDGSVHMLMTGTAEVIPIADSFEEFKALLTDKHFVMEQFVVNVIMALRQTGIPLEPSQIYGFKTPPLLGGEFRLENMEAADIAVHFSILGQIAQQVMEVPPGTKITSVTIA